MVSGYSSLHRDKTPLPRVGLSSSGLFFAKCRNTDEGMCHGRSCTDIEWMELTSGKNIVTCHQPHPHNLLSRCSKNGLWQSGERSSRSGRSIAKQFGEANAVHSNGTGGLGPI